MKKVKKYYCVYNPENKEFYVRNYFIGHSKNGSVFNYVFSKDISEAKLGTKKAQKFFIKEIYSDHGNNTCCNIPNTLEIRKIEIEYSLL